MAFCMNCGQKIPDGGKFCSNCGVAVNSAGSTQRETVYDGEIHKCPNCGEILSAFVVTCPSCGYELRGGRASNTVREFANRLTDTQDKVKKVTLIQSFPIPNNKEDILEFMILASTCFDATEKTKENNAEKDISDAWLMKVEQSYQKAKLLFNNDDDFSKIQNVYEQTYNKIKISTDIAKKKNNAQLLLRTIGVWGGLMLFIIAFFVDISMYANTSVLHLGGAVIMIIGSLMIGKRANDLRDVGIGAVSGILVILLGMLLEEAFYGNGSLMVLSGGITLIITVVQLIRSSAKKNKGDQL